MRLYRALLLLVAIAALATAMDTSAGARLAVRSAGAQASAARAGVPLAGTWDSGPFPIARVRAAALAAGYPAALITRFFREVGFGSAKTVEFNAHFYRQDGHALVRRTGWDPTKGSMPSDGDWGPYQLLPHGRMVITTSDPGNTIRDFYTYRVHGSTLVVHAIREENPSFTLTKLRLDSVHLFFFSASPLKKIS